MKILRFRVQLNVANSRKRVYFEQQILTLLLVYPTPNARIKFSTFRDKLRVCVSREAVSLTFTI